MTISEQRPAGAAPRGIGRSLGLLGGALALAFTLGLPVGPARAASDCAADGGVPCATTAEEAPGKAAEREGAAKEGTVETRATPKTERKAPKSNEIVWYFQNNYGRQIQYKLYSWDRNWAWPSGNRVFVLPANRETYKTKIQCKRGEKVCYGAWQTNNRRIFWGVGYNARYNCNNCCYTCKGVVTPTFVFRP